MTDAELKKFRMQEYYKNRVKADFAPNLEENELENDDQSPSSPEAVKQRNLKIEKVRKAKERKLKIQNEKPEWRPLYVDPNKPKIQYVKNSDKGVLPPKLRYQNKTNLSTPISPFRPKIVHFDKNQIQSVDHAAQEVKLILPNI